MESNTSLQKYIYLWLAVSLSMVFFIYSHLLETFPAGAVKWLLNPDNVQLNRFDFYQPHFLYIFVIANLVIIGICMDKFATWVLAIFVGLFTVLCPYFFSHFNQNFPVLLVFSRILLLSSLVLVTVMYVKMIASTLSSTQYALMVGLYITTALLGSSVSDLFIHKNLLQQVWQQTIILTTIGAVILAILFSILLRDKVELSTPPGWQEIRQVLQNPQNWLLATYCGLAIAPIMIIGCVAGKPFFEEAYQYTTLQIVKLGGYLLMGLVIGAPLIGYISGHTVRRRALMLSGILIQEITFIPLVYLHNMPFWASAVLLFLLGLASSAFILSLVISKEINQFKVVGTVISVVKLVTLMIVVFTEQLFGKFLIWDWDGKTIHGLRLFSIFNFHVAFIIFPIYLLLGFILLLFINEPSPW